MSSLFLVIVKEDWIVKDLGVLSVMGWVTWKNVVRLNMTIPLLGQVD